MPAQRDVLRTDVLGQLGGGPAASRIIGRAGEPGGHPRVGLGRLEVVDEIAHEQDSAGLEKAMDPVERDRLPEVRDLVQRVARADEVDRWAGVLVREEPGVTTSTLPSPSSTARVRRCPTIAADTSTAVT